MAAEAGEHSQSETRLYEVIGQYYEAVERGATVDRQEFIRQYPDLAGALHEFFTEQDRFHRMVGPLRGGVGLSSHQGGSSLLHGVEDVDPPTPAGAGDCLVGDYELLEVIARGGMGIVYKARQRSLNRLVALKMVLTTRRTSRDDALRFRNEAEAVANLDHPHIIPIYEVGEHEGRGYFAMKLVDGGSLTSRLEAFVANSRATAETMATVARAVHHAHQRGVLHRDLKPSNILMDSDGKPYVSDFGLAKRMEEDPELTLSGAILGSPPYMAMEQAAGRKGMVTTATDVYGLGAILYSLMTGRPPFQGDSVLETIEQVKEGVPKPPSLTNPTVDRDLETICLKCLSKDPQRRYASAMAFAEDLERWLAGEPIAARPVSRTERAWRWCRRNPVVAGAVVTTVVTLVGAATISIAYATKVSALAGQLQKSLAESNRLLAVRNFDHGQSAFEDGQVGQGLLWMVQSWRAAVEAGDPVWQHAARANLSAWQPYYPRLKAVLSHSGPIEAAAFSPDGRLVVTGGDDNVAQVWDVMTGRRVGSPLRHGGEVIAVAFSPDGKRILTGSADQKAQVWDLAAGQPCSPPMGHDDRVVTAVFHPDGKTVLTGSRSLAQLWDTATGQLTNSYGWYGGPVTTVAFRSDGKSIVAGGLDHCVRVWNGTGQSPVRLILQNAGEIRCMAFSPDGRTILTGGRDETARLWNARTGKPIGSPIRGHQGTIRAVAFSPDGSILFTGSTDKTARLWSAATGQPIGPTLFHQGPVVTVAFSPDGSTLLTGSSDRTVRLWDGDQLQPARSVPLKQSTVLALGISPDGKTLCTGMGNESAQLWDATTYEPKGPRLMHFARVGAVAFSPDNRKLVTGSADGAAQIWDTKTGRPLQGLPIVHAAEVSAVAFNPDGKTFVTGSQDRHIRFFDANTKAMLGEPVLQPGTVDALAFSPDGKTLLLGYDIGWAEFWDVASRTPLNKSLAHLGAVSAAAFSPDGKSVLTGCEDGTARLWDVATRRQLIPPLTHHAWVDAVAFSPDGKTLLTGSWDGTARLWDAATGMPLGPPLKHRGQNVYCVAFSRDGKSLLTGSADLMVMSLSGVSQLPQNLPRVAAWVNALTGLTLDEHQSSIRALDNAAWLASRERLQQQGGVPEITVPYSRLRDLSSKGDF